MSEEKKYEIAKEYVDRQFEIMRTFDAAPADLSKGEYEGLIEEVAEQIKC